MQNAQKQIRDVFLYNTLTRKKEKFEAMTPGKVGLYCCGPTVYHFAHIGNMRTYVFEDVLVRALKYAGFEVTHVMNITDVGHLVSDGDDGEDKMETGSKREGKSAWEIADYYSKVFFSDSEKLNILKPQIISKATDHIPEMVEMVKALEAKGFVYRTEDGLYFDTVKFPQYGAMAKLDVENLEAGKRVSMGTKHRPTDFALWKFSPEDKKRQMEWPSPWGKGFPGWHIECSAMSMKYLGETFDIHCGGKDHIPVHHTNEIAQSEASTGKPFVHYWMHGAFLNEDSGKMSKSKGDFLDLAYLEKNGFDPIDYRFLLLQAHYRSEVIFHFETLKSAQAGLQSIRTRLEEWSGVLPSDLATFTPAMIAYKEKFTKGVLDDLNTSEGLAVLFSVLKDSSLEPAQKKALAFDFDEVLGLKLKSIGPAKVQEVAPEIQKLVDERDAARKSKNWAESDRLRDELQAKGYAVKDSPQGTKITKI